MNPKIIKSNRYKKTTAKKVNKKKKNNIYSFNSNKKNNNRVNKHSKRNSISVNIFKIVGCVILIALIGIISKRIVKFDNIPIIKAFFNNDNKELVKDYDFKIGISKIDTTDITKTKNITLNEIVNMSSLKLLSFDEKYKINYMVANSVTTDDNKIFNISLNKDYKIDSDQVKRQIEKITLLGESNIYYNKLKNIVTTEIVDSNNLKITLDNSNPYFIYSLDFPLYETSNDNKFKTDYVLAGSSESVINFSRNNTKSSVRTISVINYDNSNNIIDDFKNQKVDMFITSSDSVINLIGKYEYNIKKVRNGESIFLLGNKESKLFSKKEIRQAIAYSLNREELIKYASNSFTEIIDLPFIYSNVRYKYDTYAATNLLMGSGWKKIGGVYTNTIDGEKLDLVLSLLVNKDDIVKQKLAGSIKEMLEKNGINVNIELLSGEEINQRVEQKTYDLVLANVSINSSPDIRYLESYININEKTDEAIKNISLNYNFENIDEKIENLQTVLSDEIACIGIAAYDTDIIYQKYITGFDNLLYLNIFNCFNNIGRLEKID